MVQRSRSICASPAAVATPSKARTRPAGSSSPGQEPRGRAHYIISGLRTASANAVAHQLERLHTYLERAHQGEWLPQALQARRKTLRQALAQLERQHARLLEVYLAEIIEREEFERKRQEVTPTQHSLTQQLRPLEAQAQQQVEIAALARGIEAFGQWVQPTLDRLPFAQRRQPVELLIDRVIVIDGQVEIRYIVPTGPKGETIPSCHLRLDYLECHEGKLSEGTHGVSAPMIDDRLTSRKRDEEDRKLLASSYVV